MACLISIRSKSGDIAVGCLWYLSYDHNGDDSHCSCPMQGDWHHVDGEFKSVMAIITPCRSDQSSVGLAPYGHLADGRIQLVLVHKCSRLQYLRFLASIPSTGEFAGGLLPIEIPLPILSGVDLAMKVSTVTQKVETY